MAHEAQRFWRVYPISATMAPRRPPRSQRRPERRGSAAHICRPWGRNRVMVIKVKRAFLQFDSRSLPLIDIDEPVTIENGLSLLVATSGAGKTSLLRLISGWYEKGSRIPESFALEADFEPLTDT